MIAPYIAQWHEAIRDGAVDNTYKMAWARSIVELATESAPADEPEKVITFAEIADRVLRAFWDQTIFFELVQSPNLLKRPEILQHTEELIATYRKSAGTRPVKYVRVDFVGAELEEGRAAALMKIGSTLKKDVCWRFLRVNRCEYPLYRLDVDGGQLVFGKEEVRLIAEYSDFLFDAISYRWAQILEKFNHAPRIAQKVRGIAGDEEPPRKSLARFGKHLDIDPLTTETCFECHEPILDDEAVSPPV